MADKKSLMTTIATTEKKKTEKDSFQVMLN